MTNIKYDPELPFAVVRIKGDGEGYPEGVVEARTRLETDARDLAATYQAGWVKLVDTSPKPKIPEDAEFILIETEDVARDIYQRVDDKHEASGFYWYRAIDSMAYGHEEMPDMIGDAEVTVLVRKDET